MLVRHKHSYLSKRVLDLASCPQIARNFDENIDRDPINFFELSTALKKSYRIILSSICLSCTIPPALVWFLPVFNVSYLRPRRPPDPSLFSCLWREQHRRYMVDWLSEVGEQLDLQVRRRGIFLPGFDVFVCLASPLTGVVVVVAAVVVVVVESSAVTCCSGVGVTNAACFIWPVLVFTVFSCLVSRSVLVLYCYVDLLRLLPFCHPEVPSPRPSPNKAYMYPSTGTARLDVRSNTESSAVIDRRVWRNMFRSRGLAHSAGCCCCTGVDSDALYVARHTPTP